MTRKVSLIIMKAKKISSYFYEIWRKFKVLIFLCFYFSQFEISINGKKNQGSSYN